MKSSFYYIILFFSCIPSTTAFSQGLKFRGNECFIDERTSYSVFNDSPKEFIDFLSISFEISTSEPSHIGYIFRIKNKEAKTTYNLSFDDQGDYNIFKFNEEGKSNLISINLNKNELQSSQWFNISVLFNLKKDSLTININNNKYDIGNIKLPDKWTPSIYFGKSDYIIDVPSFAIKNLIIKDKRQKFKFPLIEDHGNTVHNSEGKAIGLVSNPIWLINDAYYWRYKTSFKSRSVAGANFNSQKEEIYFFNSDSIYIYNVRTGDVISKAFISRCPMPLILGTSFIDSTNDQLYVYEVTKNNEKDTTIACLNLSDYTWKPISSQTLPMQLHHHSAYFDTKSKNYTIFGGFGNMHYSKNFYSYNSVTNQWDTLSFEKDKICPRYFSSMGYLHKTNSLYIFGGMGNESGDQVVGRRYLYDLYKVDLNNKSITKLWEIQWSKDNIVPVRGMVISDESYFYTLCYPEHFSDSYLKLYRFSIKDGSYQILGDSIPIHSEKIKTNANLYYNAKLNELYAVVQEFDDDDIASDVKIYSLAFPPVTKEELSIFTKSNADNYLWIIFISIFILSIFSLILYNIVKKQRRYKKQSDLEEKKSKSNEVSFELIPPKDKANSIYLFGEFTVFDKQNRDISYMFSTKLKQVFLIIFQYSLENGISSQLLSSLLWPEKPENKVKNSRGVTINHLRKVLDELDGIKLIYEKGLFKIICTDKLYCDCLRCLEIISFKDLKSYRAELSEILTRGKFLSSSELSIFDTFKETIERKVEPILLIEIERSYADCSFQITIHLAQAMFYIDPTSESALYYMINALIKLKMHDEAKKQYLIFTSEYKKMTGKDYSIPLSDLSNIQPI